MLILFNPLQVPWSVFSISVSVYLAVPMEYSTSKVAREKEDKNN